MEALMSDDPYKKDFRDRFRVAASQEHEVRYFANEAGITVEQALALIDKHGIDRETLMREAQRLSS